MSTAQTIREAAVTWPMPPLSQLDRHILLCHGKIFEQFYSTDRYRTFMLIVAASFDGGERVPMSSTELVRLLDDYEDCPYQAARAVEQHHGIGVKP